jgi:glyoxalase family protein
MSTAIPGIHHVTAITGNPQQNVDFYTGVLGLRLVKLTVNFDDPGAYHLYYGDAVGHPGTILTFFAWVGAPGGRHGTGQVGITSFSIPQAAVEYWRERLGGHGVHVQGLSQRFDEQALAFTDPDGLMLELVAHPWTPERPGWDGGPVPAAHAIRGLHAITLWEDGYERTAAFLTDTLGFRPLDHHGSVVRFTTGEGGPGALVDVRSAPDIWQGQVAAGTVHHVAWRTPSDEEQQAWRQEIAGRGVDVTPVLDRRYFHSIYFREPGGVLFEIATDPPGFTVDEPPEELGTHLQLPPWLEPQRAQLERLLPSLRLPGAGGRP